MMSLEAKLLKSRWTLLIPVVLMFGIVLTYWLVQDRSLDCKGGAQCGGVDPGAFFIPDTSLSLAPLVAPLQPRDALDTLRDYGFPADSIRNQFIHIAAKRYSARMAWMFFVALSALLYVGAFALGAYLIARAPLSEPSRARWAAALAVIGGLAYWFFMTHPTSQMLIMYPALRRTVEDPAVVLNIPWAALAMNRVNSVSTGITLFLVGACYLYALPDAAPTPKTAADRMRILRVFLYLATILLVVGVLRMNSVFALVGSYLTAKDAEMLEGMRQTMIANIGVSYTLLLAAVYAPAALLVRARGLSDVPDTDRDETLKKYPELDGSFASLLPRAVAILAPLLAGPVGELLRRFS